MPCTTRLPKWVCRANASSIWSGLSSPDKAAKRSTSSARTCFSNTACCPTSSLSNSIMPNASKCALRCRVMGQLAGGLECAGHVPTRGHRHVGTDKHVIRDASVFGDEHSLHQPDIGAEHRTLADHRSNPDHAAVTDTHALSNDNMM